MRRALRLLPLGGRIDPAGEREHAHPRSMSGIARFIPAVRGLRRSERAFVPRRVAGGLAVGFMLIPQGLAFAQIVHAPLVAGLAGEPPRPSGGAR
jgi:hypothetical protein